MGGHGAGGNATDGLARAGAAAARDRAQAVLALDGEVRM
jgi:hypothetical protein